MSHKFRNASKVGGWSSEEKIYANFVTQHFFFINEIYLMVRMGGWIYE